LFVINANCGRYDMPLAYLYLLILDGIELMLNDSKNKINIKVQVLYEFFSNLRKIGLLSVFAFIDKDADKILAISEA
ncbi:17630_t:CDS:1, partial [Cetraspora pellucida]